MREVNEAEGGITEETGGMEVNVEWQEEIESIETKSPCMQVLSN